MVVEVTADSTYVRMHLRVWVSICAYTWVRMYVSDEGLLLLVVAR